MQHREPPPAVSLVRFTPVPLSEGNPGLKRLGALAFLGAWTLTSNDPRIGGLSALHVEAGAALAMSDAGWRIRFPLPPRRGPVRAGIAMIEQGPGPLGDKSNRDIESLVVEKGVAWL